MILQNICAAHSVLNNILLDRFYQTCQAVLGCYEYKWVKVLSRQGKTMMSVGTV